ncbi:hypothetical protein MKK67_15165 [Methylobacterium sp. J-072]|uniref:DUF7831 domain-containing protein n=1 Tax=Methylobacterium sp. J-072 TaxID=2836651 RepID=UPI001FBA07C7|nr:hypothetical protein [Methylobacterium sp. J-072]MCJ2093821.1 hypothetical protein [Methylobacterium sp. J-072]
MPIYMGGRVTRMMLREQRDRLYVFADNLERRGLRGRPDEMRGEPNAVGIPTRRSPSQLVDAFFSDDDLDAYYTESRAAFQRLVGRLRKGGIVVVPVDGLGTGADRLKEKAPVIWQQLQNDLARLHAVAAELASSAPLARAGESEPVGP